jgi:hypothetical protein
MTNGVGNESLSVGPVRVKADVELAHRLPPCEGAAVKRRSHAAPFFAGVAVAKGFRDPTFLDRANASAAAKRALLERHKAAPKPDPAEAAAANARRLAREAEAAAAREQANAARKAAALAAEQAAAAEAQAAADAAKAAQPKVPTQAELKAARDARYAARKARNR